jgi:hypothetical protein
LNSTHKTKTVSWQSGILLCLAASSGLAGACTQTKSDPDKPARLYVQQNTIGMGFYSQEDVTTDDGSYSAQQFEYDSYNHKWTDGIGGDGSIHLKYWGSRSPSIDGWPYLDQADAPFSWPASAWPAIKDGTYTLTGANWDAWELFDGSTGSGVWSKPADANAGDFLANWAEHCNINLTWDWKVQGYGVVENFHNNYHRTADTTWHLQTGGKALPKRQNLFQISSSAAAIANYVGQTDWPLADPQAMAAAGYMIGYDHATSTPLPSQNITMDGQPVGSDGNLWVALPDNKDYDVTQRIKNQDFYTFTVDQQKYKLYVGVSTNGVGNSWPLQGDHVVRFATYCVGQKLIFEPFWRPSTPPFVEASSYFHWNLPGNYVNTSSQDTIYCSRNYSNDSSLLASKTTSCWYVDAVQAGKASIGMNLHFLNGQNVSVAALGQFNVYRPEVRDFTKDLGGDPIVGNYSGYLSLGTATYHDMDFLHYIQSDFPGEAGYTQLISGGFTNNFTHITTGYELDKTEWPRDQKTIHTGSGVAYLLNNPYFYDSPGIELSWESASTVGFGLLFKTYLRFRPDAGNAEDNIFVTLRVVTWSVFASATYSSGVWNVNSASFSTGPDDFPSDDFPIWTTIFDNSFLL